MKCIEAKIVVLGAQGKFRGKGMFAKFRVCCCWGFTFILLCLPFLTASCYANVAIKKASQSQVSCFFNVTFFFYLSQDYVDDKSSWLTLKLTPA